MLEYTLLFSIFSLFLLALYLKVSKSHEQREMDYEQKLAGPIPGIDKILKNLTLVFAVISFMTAFAFAMIGEPIVATTVNNTIFNFTSNITIVTGPQAGNTTMQVVPVLKDYVKTTTTSFTAAQTSFINGIYQLFLFLLFFFALIFLVIYAVRYFRLLKKAGKGGGALGSDRE